MRSIFALLLLLLAAQTSPVMIGQQNAAAPEALGAGLQTLHVLTTDTESAQVTFLPIRAIATNRQGVPAPRLEEMPVDDADVLVSGYVFLKADDDELRQLQARADRAFGKRASLAVLSPSYIKYWIVNDTSVLSDIPSTSGKLSPIAIQLELNKEKPSASDGLALLATARFETVLSSASIQQTTIDWSSVSRQLVKELDLNRGHLSGRQLMDFAAKLIQLHVVEVNGQKYGTADPTGSSLQLEVKALICSRLLEPEESNAKEVLDETGASPGSKAPGSVLFEPEISYKQQKSETMILGRETITSQITLRDERTIDVRSPLGFAGSGR